MWSGGLDSTAMVYEYLKGGHEVHAASCQIPNNPEQTAQEILARKTLAKLFKRDFPKTFTCDTEDTTDFGDHKGNESFAYVHPVGSPLALHQAPFWLFSALFAVPRGEKIEAVLIGYVSGDDALEYHEELKKAWRGFSGLFLEKQPPLLFPYWYTKKAELLSKLPSEYQEALWVCGSPTSRGEACNACADCRRHAQAVAEYQLSDAEVVSRLSTSGTSKFFTNYGCQFYPCHPHSMLDPRPKLNCLFCYCLLYSMENCPGSPEYLENGTKDCSKCMWPHEEGNYDALTQLLAKKGEAQ
jgi:Zn-finger protein/7-cyano-7-deazaguanine synthase in queuosine biosynthesis